MDITIQPGPRSGKVFIPSSKSQLHRLMLVAAAGKHPVTIHMNGISNDIRATAECLRAIGAEIRFDGDNIIHVAPVQHVQDGLLHLFCGESGSTLRFMLPFCGVLGAEAIFHMEGRLPERPLAPYDSLLCEHGMHIHQEGNLLFCNGTLQPGTYSIPGNISSQYISGLLMALPLLQDSSRLEVTGNLESAAYIDMTSRVLRTAGAEPVHSENIWQIPSCGRYSLPEEATAEGDCSNAAFFLCMGAFSPAGITAEGLSPDTAQGDITVIDILRRFGAQVSFSGQNCLVKAGRLHGITIDAAPIPDLIPVLSLVASLAEGETRIVNAGRLRLKESDRLSATASLLRTLGANITEFPEGLVIRGVHKLAGGTVSSFGDHRMAMTAAAAASASTGPVTITGAESVAKSYPRFYDDFNLLKGAIL